MRHAILLTTLLAACAAPAAGPSDLASTGPQPEPLASTPAAPAEDEVVPVEPREPARPTPWTEAFLSPSVLVADAILVEGPPGLFEHAVARADDALYDRKVETVPDGRIQTVRPRPGSPELEIVRAQLDAWQLAAFREVTFFERVDPRTPVRILATGEAVWRDTDGNERRDHRLTFLGELPPAE